MSEPVDRRTFATAFTASIVLGSEALSAETPAALAPMPHAIPKEAPFTRDYPVPGFQPSWKKPQLNRVLIQDFVIYAHMDLEMVKKLLEREPGLIHSHMDWGGGDFESALGAASHMGRRDIAEYLLGKGARIDIFCAAMLGQLEVVKWLLTAYPLLIDAKGPHGIGLHLHAKMGGKEAEKTLDFLQSIQKVDFSTPKKQ
ncbi:MAG TPA: ankyrin repeat domain-containing protein [Gemmata sp.]|jgi:hypothetical protein|nr:ankyrin repeat domain-containing protein [Gemmata sp.]